MSLVFWGTYDKGKPRVRILIRGLLENDVTITECHSDVWSDIEDKSQVSGLVARITRIAYWLSRYPLLIWRFIRMPRPEAVIVPYMGQLDVLMLWPFAKFRKVPIIWDAFLSLYNTVVEDRKLVKRWNPISSIIFLWEWLACKAADVIVLDTQAHADYFVNTFGASAEKTHAVFVGAEPEYFAQHVSKLITENKKISVLFYGQFIPLHGIKTIVQAARLSNNDNIHWTIIGSGQEESKISAMLEDTPLNNLTWVPWVKYDELIQWIHKADVCLGIFGDTEKAARVIPNKVFQILIAGKPVVTRDSPAIRELLNPDMPGVALIPPADPDALVQAVKDLGAEKYPFELHQGLHTEIVPASIGKKLLKYIKIANR